MQRTVNRRAAGAARNLFRCIRSRDECLGALVVAVAAVLLAGTAIVYLHPTGTKTIAFEMTDAASVRDGEDVRVAGVSVGKVIKVSLQPATVRAEARIADSTFVGDRSRIEVRMLTAVGGYYVAVTPAGAAPLGTAVIPADRVSVPYSIADVLQAVPRVTSAVSGGDIDANLEQLANGLTHNAQSVGSLITGLDSIAQVMDRQRDQVRTILDLAQEYLRTFNTGREFIFDLIQRIATLLATYTTYRDGFNVTYQLLGDVMIRLIPEEKFYLNHKQELLATVTRVRQAIQNLREQLGPTIDRLTAARSQLETWLTPQGMRDIGGGVVMAQNLCIPLPGRSC